MTLKLSVVLLVLSAAAPLWATPPCPLTHKVEQGDTLTELADFYFGDRHFDSAILLATNSRVADGFPFILDSENITTVDKVCVPDLREATRSRSRYETYRRAILDMALAEPWEKTTDLVTFPPDHEIVASTWIRDPQVKSFQDPSGNWIKTAPSELWVTVEPNLQKFCTQYAGTHGANIDQLIFRLEQRLGLPPASNKTKFLRIRLAAPTPDAIFRPCMYPYTATASCPIGPPPSDIDDNHRNWLYRQYYSSYGQSKVSSFPWTSLGYTFDWAPAQHADGDTDFLKHGESEFVIRKGAAIEILGVVSTLDYCK